MAITVATFDLDHTLVRRPSKDTQTLKMQAINRTIENVFGLKEINYMAHIGNELYGMTDRSIMRAVLGNLGVSREVINLKMDGLFADMLAYFEEHLPQHRDSDYIPLPGVEDFLQKLKERNIACGLATGNYSRFARWKLDIVGLSDYFGFGGYGEDAEERDKIVAIALKRSRLTPPDRGCHFGDTPADIKAAAANGMLSVAISVEGGGKFPPKMLNQAGADLVLDSYCEMDKVWALFLK